MKIQFPFRSLLPVFVLAAASACRTNLEPALPAPPNFFPVSSTLTQGAPGTAGWPSADQVLVPPTPKQEGATELKPNNPPVINTFTATSNLFNPKEPVALVVDATDPDGDVLYISWTAFGGQIHNYRDKAADWTPPVEPGDYNISVRVSDGRGGEATASQNISISAGTFVIEKPVISVQKPTPSPSVNPSTLVSPSITPTATPSEVVTPPHAPNVHPTSASPPLTPSPSPTSTVAAPTPLPTPSFAAYNRVVNVSNIRVTVEATGQVYSLDPGQSVIIQGGPANFGAISSSVEIRPVEPPSSISAPVPTPVPTPTPTPPASPTPVTTATPVQTPTATPSPKAVGPVVTTFAGSGGWGKDDGLKSNVGVLYPSAVAARENGEIVFIEYSENRVRKVTPDGNVVTIVAYPYFFVPQGIALAASGDIIVADTGNDRVLRVLLGTNGEATITFVAGGAANAEQDGQGNEAGFRSPNGVATDRYGNILVADYESIRMISSDNRVTTVANKSMFMGDYNFNSIVVSPNEIGVLYTATVGSIWRVDYQQKRVERLARSNGIKALSINKKGELFFLSGATLKRRTVDGTIQTVAGAATDGYVNGLGADARFHNPFATCVGPQGEIYVADFQNRVIRRIDLNE